ncbi:methyltransferase domain-containing protein [Actinoplanes sp. NPDC089786]|uniref:methyltransferase domain-containing protein n=1 Tax=Actinoplanes sp. NPDC089786 TaxID=3155185 RepID=UPI0034383FF5
MDHATVGTPFADLDRMPAPMLALLITSLEAMSRHPEIKRVRAAAMAALDPRPGQHLLDAGCGGGEVARMLAGRTGPTGSVTAVDFSAVHIEAARSRHDGSNVDYQQGDIADLDLFDASMDGVWCERVLQHVPDPEQTIAELRRVTRPGGRICLIDTDWRSLAFDGMSPELTGSLVAHTLSTFAPEQRDMGRTLRSRLVRHGLGEVSAVPVTLFFGTPASAAVVLPMVNPVVPADAGMWPDGHRDPWLTEVAAAGERGDFLAVLTIWVVTGTVLEPF